MKILCGYSGPPAKTPSGAQAAPRPQTLLHSAKHLVENWREGTLNEAVVEIPQALLDISNMSKTAPVAGGLAQAGISLLAFKRASQGLSGKSLEAKMEGASSLALGLAGTISMLPGQLATDAAKTLMGAQGLLELSLGIRELHEEFFNKPAPAWKEVATGSLDTIKGATSLLPFFFPQTTNAVNAVQIGALLSKAILEQSLHRY